MNKLIKTPSMVALIFTVISSITTVIWYAQEGFKSLERRISILESTFTIQVQQFNVLTQQVDQNNDQQTKALIRVEDLMLSGFDRIEDKVEKIHIALLLAHPKNKEV